MSKPKEIYFFSHDKLYAKGMKWYLSHFEGVPQFGLCGESSTTYTKLPTYPHAVKRIHKHLPEAKLIYIMRHPIDRLVSQYIHELTVRVIPKSVDINQAVFEYSQLVDYSLYAMQLKPYLEIFGKTQVLPVFLERLLGNSQEELERICRFINYKGQPVWDTLADKQNVSQERIMKIPIIDFFVQSTSLQPIRQRLLSKDIRKKIRSLLIPKIEKPEILPTKMEYLQTRFNEDLQILGSWLGIDLCCANFKTVVQLSSRDWVEK